MDDVVEEGGDSEGADAAGFWGDGGEIFSVSDFVGEITFEDAIFRGGAGVDNDGAWGDVIVRNQPRCARCCGRAPHRDGLWPL